MTKRTEQKHTPEAEALADAILTAAGSGLRHYSMAKTREAILAAAQQGIDAGRADLVANLRFVREWFTDNGLENDYYGICQHIEDAISGKGAA